jgi:hypothetical protein
MTQNPSSRRTLLLALTAAFVLLTAAAYAQTTINANITGGGGNGKCTFEVRVDGIANVQIRGNQGYIQTKQGMPAQWVRLKCNQPLPRNPSNFRFQGVDGHGRQYLLKDPNSNNGVAVIRIEDNRSGYEGYTGDIFWSGGNNSGGNWNGGWWNDNWNGGGGWGDNGGGGWGNSGGGQNPSGQWSVQSANYGSGNRRQDVTGNVRRLVNGPDFRVNNQNMGGDPAVGADKNLQILARSQNGTVRTFSYNEGAMVNSQMFSGGWGGGGGNQGGNNGGNWNGNNNNNWNNNVVPNCQNAIRRKIQQQANGTSVNFNGSPSTNQGGSFIMVSGNGNARANNGRQGNFSYQCTMHPNGNVADSSYNFNNGSFNPQPR